MRRKRLLLLAALGAVVFFAGFSTLSGQPKLAPNRVPPKVAQALLERKGRLSFVPGEVIVKRKVAAGTPMVLSANRLTELKLASDARTLSGGEVVYRITPTTMRGLSTRAARDRTLQAVEQLKASPEVEYAQPNYILHIVAVPDDPGFARQWHYRDNGTGPGQSPGGISLPTAWDDNKGKRDVVVAVIDTGILPNHEDIAGSPNLLPGFDMISEPAVANDGGGRDNDATDPGDATAANECGPNEPAQPSSWHGTHVAGTVGVGRTNNTLAVAGVNWEVGVQAVRVLGKCGGSIADINDGIRWAAGLPVPGVPDNPTPAKVINMSLGGPVACSQSPSTQAAINDAVNAGTTVVVAAGNEASDASGSLPAGCDNVVTVAAADARGRLAQRYSNFGATVEIMAPGGDVQRDDDQDGNPDGVYSTVEGGYAYYNGTSMASPHVAGVAALILAKEPTLTPAQVSQRLKDTALPRTSTECPQPCGAGLLSAAALLSLAVSPPAVELRGAGQTAALDVTVRNGGQPLAGQTVKFSSGNAGIASVNPPTAVTDATGHARTTIRAEAQGETRVRSEARNASHETAVRVPALSGALAGVLAAALYGVARRRTRGGRR